MRKVKASSTIENPILDQVSCFLVANVLGLFLVIGLPDGLVGFTVKRIQQELLLSIERKVVSAFILKPIEVINIVGKRV